MYLYNINYCCYNIIARYYTLHLLWSIRLSRSNILKTQLVSFPSKKKKVREVGQKIEKSGSYNNYSV